jgi:hypothetical protein
MTIRSRYRLAMIARGKSIDMVHLGRHLGHGPRMESLHSNVAVRMSRGTEVRIVDAQVLVLEGLRPGLPWLRVVWAMASDLARPLPGLACLCMAAAIVVVSARRRNRPASSPSRRAVWMLGVLLVISGIIQIAGALAVPPTDGRAGTSLLAAVACWAAALCLRSSGERSSAASSEPEPAAGGSDPAADTIVVARADPGAGADSGARQGIRRGRCPQERVPGDPGPRVAQSPGADPQCPADHEASRHG